MIQILITKCCKRKLTCSCHKHPKKRRSIRRNKNIKKVKKIAAYNPICYIKKIKIKMRPSVSIRPIVKRYFLVAPDDIHLTKENVIFANQFVDDKGEAVKELANYGQKGYFNLYINGVLQEGNLYRVSSKTITLAATGQMISKGTPIIVESVGFKAKLKYK